MYSFSKRVVDIIIALTVLILLLPLMLPVLLLLRLTAEGEVFYFQQRVGLNNQIFNIWKFATMLKNSPNMLTGSLTLRNDPRVTTMGKILRLTKINELPQLVNVLIGDMSIVGPRPQVMRDFLAYPQSIQSIIYKIKPGITGIGSIIFRDEEKLLSETDLDPHEFYRLHIAPYKGELELWYQQNASPATDLLLLFLTIWQLFSPHSNLAYLIFNDLPARPEILEVKPNLELNPTE